MRSTCKQRYQPARTLIIHAIPPFRLDLTVWALRRRSRNAIDRWDGVTYRRVIAVPGRSMELAVRQAGSRARPRLIVETVPAVRTVSDELRVTSFVENVLGPRIDLDPWYRMAGNDSRLSALAARFRGMKPPRFPTLFEALVNGIACQQLSLIVGLELLNRLAALCAATRETDCGTVHAFPTPRDVSQLRPSQCHAIGFSRQKVRALLNLARGIESGDISVEGLSREDDATARARLLAVRGVGRWTAEYVMLRGLGRLHVFPGDDVGAQKSLARWLGRPSPLDYAAVSGALEKWEPYAGMVYFHLLLDGLSKAGLVSDLSPPFSLQANHSL
jgi:DNA-3-methyladenine glycosylase II